MRHQGRRREAEALLDDVQASGKGYGAYPALVAFLNAAGDGPTARLRQRAHFVVGHDASHRELVAAALALGGDVEGGGDFAAGLSPDRPARRIVDALRAPPADAGSRAALVELARSSDHEVRRQALYALGVTCLRAGDHARAIDAFTRFRAIPWSGPLATTGWDMSRARLLLATALEASGRTAEARREGEGLLETWRRADPDLPDLAEARSLCARVGCRVSE
jgi:hypothetical protein